MAKYLTICAILITGSGCCQTPVDTAIGLPPRPTLIQPTSSQVDTLERVMQSADDAILDTVETREAVRESVAVGSHNDLALKEYARKLEARILAHDEMFTE